MLHFSKFIAFLYEEFLSEELKTGSKANSAGVAFETKTLKRLNGGQHPKLHPDENGMSPEEAHNHHSSNIEPEEHAKVESGAQQAHHAIIEHMVKTGFVGSTKEGVSTHWTSKPGQVSKVTGKDEKNNPADGVVTNKEGRHLGISFKYGENPGLRSPGLKDLASLTGHSHNQSRIDDHKKSLVKMMGKHVTSENQSERNKQFREAEKNPKAAKHVEAVKNASREFRSQMASDYATAFNQQSHEHHQHAVRRLLNAEATDTPVIKVHHDPKKNKTSISDPVGEFSKLDSKTSHYTAKASGTKMHVYAHTHDGETHHIATIGIKDKSSPMTNIVGAVSHGKDYQKVVE